MAKAKALRLEHYSRTLTAVEDPPGVTLWLEVERHAHCFVLDVGECKRLAAALMDWAGAEKAKKPERVEPLRPEEMKGRFAKPSRGKNERFR